MGHQQDTRSQVGGMWWLLCVQFFVVEQIAARAWQTHYSFIRNYVSDLGAVACGAHNGLLVCSPLHAEMNASFVVQGLLIFGGAVMARRAFPATSGYVAGLALLMVSGVGVLVVGLAPEDLHGTLHVVGATMHFVCGGAGIATLGVAMARDASSVRAGYLSIMVGTIVILATGLLLARGSFAGSIGLIERIPAYGIPLWLMGMGASVWLTNEKAVEAT